MMNVHRQSCAYTRNKPALAVAVPLGAAVVFGAQRIAYAHKTGALPPAIVSQVPDMHPLGHGKRTVWGLKVYHATLWVSGHSWTPSEPHAVELEPARTIPAATLLEAALEEMHDLNLGNEARLKVWRSEMGAIVPSVKQGDDLVIFCPVSGKTLVYLDGRERGTVDDTTLCPAIMSIWLHPATSQQELRRALLKQ
jgi:hypothetical protein